MSSREIILQLLASSLELKLTLADMRRSQHRLTALPLATVKSVMLALSEQRIPGKEQNLKEELCRVLLCAVSYRFKMTIREMYTYYDSQYGETGAYLCPRCESAIEFDFQAYCSSCGQALDWDDCENATIRRAGERRL